MKQIFQRFAIYFLLAIPALVVFAPVLFFGQIFADGDAILQQYPSMHFLKETLQARDSLFWNSHVLTGFIPVVGLMGGLLSWANQLLYAHFSVFSTFAWITFANFALTAIFTYELARKLDFKIYAGIFAALVAPWTAAYFAWAANMTVTPAHWLLPAFLYFVLCFAEGRSLPRAFILAAAGGLLIGTNLLSAHFQWALQGLTVAGLFALLLDWKNIRGKSPGLFRFQTCAFFLFLLIVAGILAWPQYHASYLALPFSGRAEGVSFFDAQRESLIPGDALSLFFPNLSLPKGITQPGFLYIGALPLMFLLYSFGSKKNFYYKFFAWLFFISLAASIRYSPVMWLAHKLPLYDSFRGLSRFMYVGLFAAVILAAYGFESFVSAQAREKRRYERVVWYFSLAAFGLFAVWSAVFPKIGLFLKKLAESALAGRQLTLPPEHYAQVLNQLIQKIQEGSTFPNLPITVAVTSLVLGAGLIYFGRKFAARQLIIFAIVFSCLNLLLINGVKLSTVSAEILKTPPPPVDYLKKDPGDFRIFTFFAGFTSFDKLDTPYGYNAAENVDFLKNLLTANINMLYDVDGLDYYDNLMDRRHSRILGYLGSNRSIDSNGRLSDENISFEEKKRRFLERLPLLSEYNVKYIISAYPLNHPSLRPAFTWEATRYNIPLTMYENSSVKPRYFFTQNTMFSPLLSEPDSWQENMKAVHSGKTLIECKSCPQAGGGAGEIFLESQRNAEYSFRLKSEGDNVFIFGQNFLPGWTAELDGKQAEIFRANFVNQAVAVPAGEHELIFRYQL